MSATHESDSKVTPVEASLWVAFIISTVVYVIAFLVLANLGVGESDTLPAGWMTFSGMIAGLTFVPAIILTGLRQLVPALRGVPRGE